VWAAVVGFLGYAAGEMVERLLADASRYELLVALLLALAVALCAFFARRGERHLEEPVP
jgi:membrane protein DedA with SNARE-associated domain